MSIIGETQVDKKKELQAAITDFRKKYIGELETNLMVAMEIRDDTKASPRDRNEAVKTISRLLGSLQPERIAPAKSDAKSNTPSLSEAEQEEIERQITEVLGG